MQNFESFNCRLYKNTLQLAQGFMKLQGKVPQKARLRLPGQRPSIRDPYSFVACDLDAKSASSPINIGASSYKNSSISNHIR